MTFLVFPNARFSSFTLLLASIFQLAMLLSTFSLPTLFITSVLVFYYFYKKRVSIQSDVSDR